MFYGAYDPEAPAVGTAEKVMSGFSALLVARNALLATSAIGPLIQAWAESIAKELESARALVLA